VPAVLGLDEFVVVADLSDDVDGAFCAEGVELGEEVEDAGGVDEFGLV